MNKESLIFHGNTRNYLLNLIFEVSQHVLFRRYKQYPYISFFFIKLLVHFLLVSDEIIFLLPVTPCNSYNGIL